MIEKRKTRYKVRHKMGYMESCIGLAPPKPVVGVGRHKDREYVPRPNRKRDTPLTETQYAVLRALPRADYENSHYVSDKTGLSTTLIGAQLTQLTFAGLIESAPTLGAKTAKAYRRTKAGTLALQR